MTIAELASAIGVGNEEVAERLRYLHSCGHISLGKFYGIARFEFSESVRVPYNAREFLFDGGFLVGVTPSGRKYFETLEHESAIGAARDDAGNEPKSKAADDRRFARIAIEEARKSSAEEDGRIHPKVGAVVVKDSHVLAKAHRGQFPSCHAEYVALERILVDVPVSGATVYTTLEPCTTRNHPKIPCADRLVERRVARVVIGMLDPNPQISGRGQRALRKGKITTDLFPSDLMDEVEELNREFIRDYESAADGPRRWQPAELERLKALEAKDAPRTLTPDQRLMLAESLRPYAGTSLLIVELEDEEAVAFARQIRDALQTAGWNIRTIRMAMPASPPRGVTTILPESGRASAAVDALMSTFLKSKVVLFGERSGLLAQTLRIVLPQMHENATGPLLFVGRKPA